mgnify:CR=1 FL=1
MANVYGYMRISTKEERGKQQYTRQEQALNRYSKETGEEFVLVFKEDQSGKTFKNRTQWKKLESIVQPGDCIVFKSIDRFTRNVDEGLDKYMDLMQKGVKLCLIDNPTLSTDYMKNLLNIAENQEDRIAKESLTFIARILLIAELDRAEKERQTISKRTKDGMAARKAEAEAAGKEWHAGRKPGQVDKMTPELEADIALYLADRYAKGSDIMRKHHISRNTLKKYTEIVKRKM